MSESITADHRLPLIMAVSLVLLGISGAAFYGWLHYGSTMLLALGENGFSWCF